MRGRCARRGGYGGHDDEDGERADHAPQIDARCAERDGEADQVVEVQGVGAFELGVDLAPDGRDDVLDVGAGSPPSSSEVTEGTGRS